MMRSAEQKGNHLVTTFKSNQDAMNRVESKLSEGESFSIPWTNPQWTR